MIPLEVTEPPMETSKNVVTFASSFGMALHAKIVVKNKRKRKVSQSEDYPLAMTDEKKPRSTPLECVPKQVADACVLNQQEIAKQQAARQPRQSTKKKNTILDNYMLLYGPESTYKAKGKPHHPSIITSIPSRRDLVRQSTMKPSLDKSYRVMDLKFDNVVTTVIKEMGHWLSPQDFVNLSMASKTLQVIVPETLRLLSVDFTPLLEPRLNYQDQTEVCEKRIDMASALMIHYDLDPGMAVRFLGGEYTGANRPVQETLDAVRDHVSSSDYEHIKRVLLEGCPSVCALEESTESKLDIVRRGNQKNYQDNPEKTDKTLNKEDRYSHLLPIRSWLLGCSAYCRHTPLGYITKVGKNDRMVWDASTKRFIEDFVLNEHTPTDYEAEVTFGLVYRRFKILLFNMRVSFPDVDILLALADIKACFRYPRMHADVTGAFGFMANDMVYCLATAMVFGSVTSSSSWEPLRRAIEALTKVYFDRDDLVEKHAYYLEMIKWDDKCLPGQTFVKAKACPINPGIFGPDGRMIQLPAGIYVDDALMAAPGERYMKKLLAAAIEAIFAVMGPPDTKVRQCPLAMDKWIELIVGHLQIMLGIKVNTRRLTVGMPREYLDECLSLITNTFHAGRKKFTAQQGQKLVGKLARLGEGAPWVYHLMSHMYTSIAYALRENTKYLKEASNDFRKLVANIERHRFSRKDNASKHVNFALKQLAKSVHHCKEEYIINETMRVSRSSSFERL